MPSQRHAFLRGVLLSAGVATLGCGHELRFDHLRAANRIEVTTIENKPLATVTDSVRIRSLLEFLAGHSKGWSEHLTSRSVPDVTLNFYEDGRYLGGVGLGSDYLTDHPSRSFDSTDVEPAEISKVRSLVGLSSMPGGAQH
jgi:hypothetical protein